MEQITAVLKSLADKNRLRIVTALLGQEELCACQVTELIEVSGATASRHLSVLVASGLLKSRKQGRWVYYRLHRDNPSFQSLFCWIDEQLKNDIEALSDEKKIVSIVSIDPEELCRKQRGEECCPKK